MAFKLVCVYMMAVAAISNAGVLHDTAYVAQTYAAPFTYSDTAVGTTQEKVVRSFDGTVSHYSKSVDTPFSSVRKTDTRINNKVYSPVVKTISTPVVKTIAPVTYHTSPVVKTVAYHTAPVVKTVSPVAYHAAPVAYHSAPVAYHTSPVVKTVAPVAYHTSPVVKTVAPVKYHNAPAAYHTAPVAHTPITYAASQPIYSSPVVKTVEHAQPLAYAHQAPVEAAYHTKTLSYSPASAVAHVSFDGMGAHYEW
ncbi:hypothetical protein ACFFRR_005164 [Megaselia abdita]